MTFAEKLQKLRKQNGLSQEQLAEKLNVSRQAVSKWEMERFLIWRIWLSLEDTLTAHWIIL